MRSPRPFVRRSTRSVWRWSCEGTHLCMSMRGVEKQNSCAVTSAMLGAFQDNARTRMEFLELIRIRTGNSLSNTPGLACVGD